MIRMTKRCPTTSAWAFPIFTAAALLAGCSSSPTSGSPLPSDANIDAASDASFADDAAVAAEASLVDAEHADSDARKDAAPAPDSGPPSTDTDAATCGQEEDSCTGATCCSGLFCDTHGQCIECIDVGFSGCTADSDCCDQGARCVAATCEKLGSDCSEGCGLGLMCNSQDQCELPTLGYQCDPGWGCGDGSVCGFVHGVAESGNVCSPPCTTSADCTDAADTCQGSGSTKYCGTDYCGPTSPVPTQDAFFGPCNSRGTGDGRCLPAIGETSSTPVGWCFVGGSIAVGQSCPTSPTSGALDQFCVAGAICTVSGKCEPVCAASGAPTSTPTCTGGATCDQGASGCKYPGVTSCTYGACD